eukprot:g38841.t1
MIDEHRAVDVIHMDFSKVIDKAPHVRPVSKIRSHGILGELAIWIQNWLKDRSWRVAVKGCFSDWRPATSDVPQKSMLGLLLFIIYVNDLDVNVGGMV